MVLYFVLAAVLFAPMMARGEVLCFRDLADYAIPHKLFAVAELREGRIPLWNPWDFFGFPHLANLQSGVLYPLNVLLFLPFPFGFNLSLVVHFVIAATGTFGLARELRVSPVGATLAGVSYGFGPFLLSLTDLNAFLSTSSWLPWQVALGMALGRAPTVARTATVTLVFVLAFLAGEPQTFAVAALLAALASLLSSERSPRHLGRLVLAWTTAAVSTVLLVSPVLFPFLELAVHGDRAGAGLNREDVFRYSLEGEELLTMVLPGYSGDVVEGTHWVGSQTYVRRPFLGVMVLALAAAGFLSRGARAWIPALIGLSGLLMAMGPGGVLYPLLYDLGFRQSRFPVKFLVLSVLALAILAGRGFDALGAWPGRRSGTGRVVACATLVILATIGGIIALSGLALPARLSGLHTFVAAGLGLLAVGLRPATKWSGVAILLVLIVDLTVASKPVLTSMPADRLLTRPALLTGLRFDPCWWPRVFNPLITEELLGHVYSAGRVDAAAMRRKQALLFGNTNLFWRIPVVRGGESVQVRSVSTLLSLLDRGPEARRLVDLAGVGYLVHVADLSAHGFPSMLEGEESVFTNPGASPHAFLVSRAIAAEDSSAIDALLLDRGFNPREEAVSEVPLGEFAESCSAAPVTWTACSNTRIELDVDSPGRCLLVVTDTWYPGWRAEVEGVETPIHRVDAAFRGVIVERGRKRVTLTYTASGFRRGCYLAAFAFAAWVMGAVALRLRRGSRV